MLPDPPQRGEVELDPVRAMASMTVARCDFMLDHYGFATPITGNKRLRHEYRLFVRPARFLDAPPLEPRC